MIRLLDIILSTFGLLIGAPLLLLIYFVGLLDTGSPIFFQERVGRNQKPFILMKFRTMNIETISIATHLVDATTITTIGRILRRTKLDELPQLWNVLTGQMSLVGPRPCLLSQVDLINARERLGVFSFRPGITGLAQLSNIDMSEPMLLAEIDAKMLSNFSLKSYFKYIFMTAIGKGSGDRINADAK